MKTRLLRKRLAEPEKNRSTIPAIIVAIICWIAIAVMVLFVDPQILGAIPTVFILLLVALFLTLTAIFRNRKRSILYCLAAILFLLLCYFGVGNVLNLILIAGIVISIEIFTYTK